MWITELATNTNTADRRIGSHSDIKETMSAPNVTEAPAAMLTRKR